MWKEFEVEMVNKKEKGMGIGRSFPSRCYIDINTIVGIIENEDDDFDPAKPMVTLLLSSGDSLSIYAEYGAIKNLIKLGNPNHYANS